MGQYQMNDKKIIHAWAMFDWANSVYSLIISTAIFPIYYLAYTPEKIQISGIEFTNSSLYTFSVSFSFIFIALFSPLFSGIADYSGRRKFFLRIFTLIGSVSCMLLYWFDDSSLYLLGTIGFIMATIGAGGSSVFYDSYLPLIVTEDRYNDVSARGFTYGYIGSVILLIFILIMGAKPDIFGLTDDTSAYRVGFFMVGVWWLGFAQYTLFHLPQDQKVPFTRNVLINGYKELISAFHRIRKSTRIKRFLASFFFYSAGVQTIIYVATIFASKELGFESTELIIIVLIIQLVAIAGAWIFSRLANSSGNKFSLMTMIIIWILICLGAYFTYSKSAFYFLAALVGMVIGGIQSLSRATYSKILPEKDHDTTSYFSFYDVLYKVAVVGGTFLFGFVENVTSNMRYSVLILAFCFVVGLIIMAFVDFNVKERKSD
jgi:UMF1 family MFS transporter